MRNVRLHMPFSLVSLMGGTVAVLVVAYLALIAVVMSYAALTIEFSQSLRNDEASVAALEGQYLTALDYTAAGYAQPVLKTFVRAKSVTALR